VGDELTLPFRRPPISPSSIVARAEGSMYAAEVWALSLVQGRFFCRSVPNPNSPIGNLCIAVWSSSGDKMRMRMHVLGSSRRLLRVAFPGTRRTH
jgi:hypothetical protein